MFRLFAFCTEALGHRAQNLQSCSIITVKNDKNWQGSSSPKARKGEAECDNQSSSGGNHSGNYSNYLRLF